MKPERLEQVRKYLAECHLRGGPWASREIVAELLAEVGRLREEIRRAMRVLGCPSSMATPPEEVPLAQSILEQALAAKPKAPSEVEREADDGEA